MVRIGIDTGGTFTDFALFDGERLAIHKVPSTPDEPARAVLEGLTYLLGGESKGAAIIHGTTVATNTLLERKGADVALITTRGFEHVIEIGRQNRGELYDFHWKPPRPLVPRRLRFGITERTTWRGEIRIPVDVREVEMVVEAAVAAGAQCIAVSLLHSYAQPANEFAVERVAVATGLPVTVSARLLPEFREYERTATVVANSYLTPVVKGYIEGLARALGGAELHVMQSNGGIISPETAAREPVRLILSGPAGGVVGGVHVARMMGYDKVLTYDMGGTSTDVALTDGEIKFTTETLLDGIPIKVPMIEVKTIGAGGGSIARLDPGGALKVGPESAGASPGPACYGVGGEPTVTDANVVLGRIRAEWFLGGRMRIDPALSAASLRPLAERMGLSLESTAQGVVSVSNSNMERALRVISIGKGYDPREFVLVSFGGAGGLHACDLGRSLGVKAVLFPSRAGALSAVGMLLADAFRDYSRACFVTSGQEDAWQVLARSLSMLEDEARREFAGKSVVKQPMMDARYRRQSHEITIPFCKGFVEEFHRAHERLYGYRKEDAEVEVVALRLRVVIPMPKLELPPLNRGGGAVESWPVELHDGTASRRATCYVRDTLPPGFRFAGPAVVVEETATLFIPPDYGCEVDGYGNIVAVPRSS